MHKLNALPVVALALSVCNPVQAQIVTDGSVGPQVTLDGPNAVITESLGTRSGSNLFHSFQTFNIDAGGTATFTGAADIGNVISRVTGGEVSIIQGALRSEVGSADFYFVNPAGVAFGPGGSVDVPASFHLSTADELRFSDGSTLDTSSSTGSSLAIAAPEAFGFLGNSSGVITFAGTQVAVGSGENNVQAGLSLSARDIAIDNSNVRATDAVRIAAVGSVATSVDLNADTQSALNGTLQIVGGNGDGIGGTGTLQADAGLITVSGGALAAQSNMTLRANDLVVSDAGALISRNNIDINAVNSVQVLSGSAINSSTESDQNAGDVKVTATNLLIDGLGTDVETGISSIALEGSGNTGNIEVSIAEVAVIRSGGIISTDTFADGSGGSVSLAASQLVIDRQGSPSLTGIINYARPGSTGNAGAIDVTVAELTSVQSGGSITSNTESQGAAGNVAVNTAQLILDGVDSDISTGIGSQALSGTGGAGDVQVSFTESATIRNLGLVSSDTFSQGDAGNTIISGPQLSIENGGQVTSNTQAAGNAGTVGIAVDELSVIGQNNENFTGVFSNANAGSSGVAGDVNVTVTGGARIESGGSITSSTATDASGGNVTFAASQLSIDGSGSQFPTGIASQAVAGLGNAGSVEVTIDELTVVQNGGVVSSDTFSDGNAGNVRLRSGQLQLSGQAGILRTGVSSSANPGSGGNAGTIEVFVEEITSIANGATITSGTESTGDAGAVLVSTPQLLIDSGSSGLVTGIGSQAISGTGNGGSVVVTVTERAVLQNQGLISSDTFSDGNAGNATVTAPDLQIKSGGQITSSTNTSGDAGLIEVRADQLLIDSEGNDGVTGIVSDANVGSSGSAGNIAVTVTGLAALQDGASITSNAFSSGDAGNVDVVTSQLTIDGLGNRTTGIGSQAVTGTGNAGSVAVFVEDQTTLTGGGIISSDTFTEGDAGNVNLDTGQLLIDRRRSGIQTGVFSQARVDSSGDAGVIDVNVGSLATIQNGGEISSDTNGAGNAGNVSVTANQLTIDLQQAGTFTGISSGANPGSAGNAGLVSVNITELAAIEAGGLITSNTESTGNAGNVEIIAGQLLVDGEGVNSVTGIASQAIAGSTGDAGSVNVTVANAVTLQRGGLISSDTFGEGNAGNATVSAEQLFIDRQNSDVLTGIFSNAQSEFAGTAGIVEVDITNNVSMLNGGAISSNTSSAGDAGSVRVTAGQLSIDGGDSDLPTGIGSQSLLGSGNAGTVEVVVSGLASISKSGLISSDTFAAGDAGVVTLTAGELLIDRLDGSVDTGLFSRANTDSSGNAGGVNAQVAGLTTVRNGGAISSDTFSVGNAGDVMLSSGQLLIDRQGNTQFTGVSSDAIQNSSGEAGSVQVTVSGNATIQNGGVISSDAFSSGDAGNVMVSAGSLQVDGLEGGALTGIFSQSREGATGNAGSVQVDTAQQTTIQNGAGISSDTRSTGNAGNVTVATGTLLIDRLGNNSFTGISSDAIASSGDAGGVQVTSTGATTIQNGGVISSDTFADGNAGDVLLSSEQLLIDSLGSADFTGVTSTASEESSGDAGSVEVNVSNVATVQNGGVISSDTFSQGDAGNVQLTAGRLMVDGADNAGFTGISSDALQQSSGDAGSVSVEVVTMATIQSGGVISSDTFSEGDAGDVNVSAERLLIDAQAIESDARISSRAPVGSTGEAGSVNVDIRKLAIVRNGGEISTISANNQAGPVQVRSGSIILNNGVISTTTDSELFSGGEITIDSDVMVLDSGVVQANAVSGQGGQIAINSAIIGSVNQVLIGGTERLAFQFDGPNVLQAVAPTGITVPPTINSPDIDISGSLAGLDTNFVDNTGLASDPCAAFVEGAPSTMVTGGKGGLQQRYSYTTSIELVNRIKQQARDIRLPDFAEVASNDWYLSKGIDSCRPG